MTRSALSAPSALTSVFVLALTAACGHSSQTLDAYEKTKEGAPSTGSGGSGNPSGGTSGTSGTSASGTSGTSGSAGMAVSCDAAPSQQFDSAHMKAYTEADDPNVQSTLNAMTNEGRASQMLGVKQMMDLVWARTERRVQRRSAIACRSPGGTGWRRASTLVKMWRWCCRRLPVVNAAAGPRRPQAARRALEATKTAASGLALCCSPPA